MTNRHLILLYASFVTLTGITVSSARADETLRSINAATGIEPTLISGFQGSDSTTKEPGSSAILSGLEFDEVGDKPCFIRSHWWRFTSENIRQEFTTTFNICSKTVDGDKSILFSNARTTKTGVHGIQVCNNGQNNHRVKGVRLFGATVDKDGDGQVKTITATPSFERTNCKPPWKSMRTCDGQKIAVGLIVKHTKDEITGLGLRCADIQVKPVQVASNTAALFAEMEKDVQVQVDKDGKTEKMSILEALERHEAAGATVVVIDDGKVAVVRHYGMRNAKDNLKTNKDTIYQAASISKLFGALAMAKAARLDHGPKLDDTAQRTANSHRDSLIDKWTEKKFKGDEKDYPKDITVRRLMGHSAGLSNWGIGNSKRDNATELETILLGDPFTDSTKPRVRPGTDWCYSGGGVSAAEAMLNIESGRAPRVFLNEMIEEYGLTKSTFNDAKDSMDNLARGCSRGPCSTKPKHTGAKFAGGMLANPEEFAQVVALLMNDGKDEAGKQVIPTDDVHAILTPTFHRSSSLKSCRSTDSCGSGELCVIGRCMKPLEAKCGASDFGSWYGMGVFLAIDDPFGADGYPRKFEHGGANPDGDSATHFEADRKNRNGVVIMVNGEYKWTKKGVTYGANALAKDMKAAFDRHF